MPVAMRQPGFHHSPETLVKLRLAAKGRVITEEAKVKMRLAKLGKTLTLEHRRKVSIALTGRVRSQQHCDALSSALRGLDHLGARGEKHHAWKGGVTPPNLAERWGVRGRAWSRSILERDGFTCTVCGGRGGRLIAHHILSFAENPGLRLNLNNGVTVCNSCHREAHLFFAQNSHRVSKSVING